MFNFFKKKSKYPSFRLLWTFDKRDCYFVRNAEWGWLDKEHIFVTDNRSLKTITLEEWHQMFFLQANGQMTVTEYVRYVADQYTTAIPDTLDHIIVYGLLELAKKELIKFSNTQQTIAPEFEQPGLQG